MGNRLSPLWEDNRGQFVRFQLALAKLSNAYDERYGDRDERGRRIRISTDDIDGLPIVGTFPLPVAALDDLLLLVEDLTRKRRQENKESGHYQEHDGHIALRYFDKDTERGANPDDLKARMRASFEEAASLAEQPDDMPQP